MNGNDLLRARESVLKRNERLAELEAENARLRSEVTRLQSAPAPTPATPAPDAELSRDEKIKALQQELEQTTSNARIWEICGEIDKLRFPA